MQTESSTVELEHKLKELDDPSLVSFGSPEPVTM